MQSYKKLNKWHTAERAKDSHATSLFPVVVYDFNTIARKGHAGYLHLISTYFKRKTIMNNTEVLTPPTDQNAVLEAYEYILFDTHQQQPIFGQINGYGLKHAASQIKHDSHQHLVSISLMPFKIDA